MRNEFFFALGCGLFALCVIWFALTSWSRGRSERTTSEATVRQPNSNIRVITTTEEIGEAARRAAAFERAVATSANERALHYETVANESCGQDHGNVRSMVNGSSDQGKRSA